MIEQLTAMPKYEEYKDSGVEWLGTIPDYWLAIPVRAIFEERNEKNIGPITDHILSVTKDRGVIPYDEKGAIGNNKSEDIERYKLVYKNDLVINKMNVVIGSLGLSKYFGALSQVYIVLRPKSNEFNIHFYSYLVGNSVFYKSLIKYCTGIMELRESLDKDEFKKLPLPVPPLSEQTAIVAFLDCKTAQIDQAVAIKEKQIDLLKERKQILIQNAVTRGFNSDAPMRDSGVQGIGEIPEHWSCSRLKIHSKIQSGITLGKVYPHQNFVEFPYIRVANVQNGYFKLDDIAKISVPKYEISRYMLQNGDILVTEGGDIDKLGRGTVWRDEIKPCLHQNHVFAIRVNRSKLSQEFVSNFLATDIARKYFINTATKTTNLASTNRTHLGNLYLPVPPLKEQTDIVVHIETESTKIDQAISLQQQQIGKLKEYKATLINSAVTGKIRVPELVESSVPELADSLVA